MTAPDRRRTQEELEEITALIQLAYDRWTPTGGRKTRARFARAADVDYGSLTQRWWKTKGAPEGAPDAVGLVSILRLGGLIVAADVPAGLDLVRMTRALERVAADVTGLVAELTKARSV